MKIDIYDKRVYTPIYFTKKKISGLFLFFDGSTLDSTDSVRILINLFCFVLYSCTAKNIIAIATPSKIRSLESWKKGEKDKN